MRIKRTISFKLFAYGKNKDKFQIRMRSTFNGQRLDIITGCIINNLDYWDSEEQLVKNNYKSINGDTSSTINSKLQLVKEQLESSFMYFEALEIFPSKDQVLAKYREKTKDNVPSSLFLKNSGFSNGSLLGQH